MQPEATTLLYEPGVQRVLTTREQARSYYNKIARVYDLLAEKSEGPMREAGLQLLAVAPGERALEVGFGTGHCLVELAASVGDTGRVYGVDLSDAMLDHAAALLKAKGLDGRVELHRGDAAKLPHGDASLDVVFTSFTLELFDTPELPKVLAEFGRVLRPGGRLGVVAVSREGEHGVMVHLYEWAHLHFPNFIDCRPIYVRRALEAAGFAVAHAEVRSMWVPVEVVVATKPA